MKALALFILLCFCLSLTCGSLATPEAGEAEMVGIRTIEDLRWQRNGDWIAFTRDKYYSPSQKIYKIRADGTGLRMFNTSGDTEESPQWDPAGRLIGFHSKLSGEYKTITMNGTLSSLGIHTGCYDFLGWSPDGKYTACIAHRDNDTHALLMTPKGKEIAPIGEAGEGDWHPSGRFMVVTRSSPDLTYTHLWEIDTKTKQSRQLTFGNYSDFSPRYSPQGDLIVFYSPDRQCQVRRSSVLFIMLRDGSCMAPVMLPYKSSLVYSGADFSPNGQYLVFARGEWTPSELFTCRLDGSGLRKLTSFYPDTISGSSRANRPPGKWWIGGNATTASSRSTSIIIRNVLMPDKKMKIGAKPVMK